MTVHAPAMVPAFSLTLPAAWIVLDLESLSTQQFARDLVDQRVAEGLLDPAWADVAAETLSAAAGDAAARGARLAAGLVFDDGDGPGFVTITATYERFAPKAADEVEVQLRSAADAPAPASPMAVRGEHSERVELAAGTALRVERFLSGHESHRESQEFYVVQYLVPVAANGLTLTLTAASGAVFQKEDIDDVIGEIAATLEIERGTPAGADESLED